MVQFVLIIAGIVCAFRLRKIKARTADQYPATDTPKFTAWHAADVKAAGAFVWATLGGAVLTVIASIAAPLAASGFDEDTRLAITLGAVLIAFLAPLAWAASLGSESARLKKAAGIK